MPLSGNANYVPVNSNGRDAGSGFDPVGQQNAAIHIGNISTGAGYTNYGDAYTMSSDGSHVAVGATTDSAYTGSGGAGLVSLLKGVYAKIAGMITVTSAPANNSGVGMASFQPYGWNGLAYDRIALLQSKGYFYSDCSGITVGQKTATFTASSATIASIQPGMQINFLGTAETLNVSASYVPTTATTVTVTFQQNFLYTHTGSQWNAWAANGPTTNPFFPDGVVVNAPAIFDGNAFQYYVPQGKAGVQEVNVGGRQTTPIAAAATAFAVKGSGGRLARALITTTGSAALSFYDNASVASGTIIGYIPASAASGTMYDFQMPAANGIWCASGTNTPAVTVSWT